MKFTKYLLLVSFALFIGALGCGRNGLSTQCVSDAECETGQTCVGGFCATDINNQTNNQTNNGTGCGDDGDCGEGEVCDDDSGECVADLCRVENDVCVRGDGQLCLLGCGPGFTQEGCECVAIACQFNSECELQICIDGVCQNCSDDSQCGIRELCSDGQCVEDTSCRADEDCSSNQRCSDDGVCVNRPQCLIDADCDEDELCISGRCTVAPECSENVDCPDGFECVGDICFETLCRGPGYCPDQQICDAGECVDPPITAECFVGTSNQIIVNGQNIALEAFAFDGNGAPIFANFEWRSSRTQTAAINGLSAVGGSSRGRAVVTADAVLPNGTRISCSGDATLTNPGEPTAGSLRIIVTDLESSRPLDNVRVVVDGQNAGTTNAAGIVNTNRPPGSFEVSTFHPNRDYVTVKNVNSATIRVPLKPISGRGAVAGFTGSFDFSQVHSSGTINLGLAGASLRGGLLDVNLAGLLGDNFNTDANIPGFGNLELPLPGGLVLGGGPLQIKSEYYAQTSGGSRFAWGLGGRLPFLDLIQLFQGGGLDGTNVLATLLPLFSRFDHAAVPRSFAASARVRDVNDIDNDGNTNERLPDYNNFPSITLRPDVPQTLASNVDISNFPFLSGNAANVAVVVGGTLTAETGLVPLGITAIQDADGDGRPDTQRLSIAPNHGALVGSRYAVVAIAFSATQFNGQFALPEEFSVALWNGQNFATSTALGTFPDASSGSIMQRRVDFTADAGPLYRIRIVGNDRSWEVWDYGTPSPGQFSHSMQIPQTPNGVQDIWSGSDVFIDAIQSNTDLTGIVGSSGVGLENAGLVSSAFNRTRAR